MAVVAGICSAMVLAGAAAGLVGRLRDLDAEHEIPRSRLHRADPGECILRVSEDVPVLWRRPDAVVDCSGLGVITSECVTAWANNVLVAQHGR